MKYSLLIQSAPGTAAARSALAFTDALLAAGHEIHRLFFYQAGVGLADRQQPASRDWQQRLFTHQLDAVVCITEALRHGLVSEQEAQGAMGFARIAEGFQVSGLGQLADALGASDRVVTFG